MYLDLIGLAEDEARGRLLAGVAERLKPSEAPAFPGARHAGEASPAFPGDEQTTSPEAAAVTPPAGQTWVKINDMIVTVDEVDDAGDQITLKGALDNEALRRLDEVRHRGFGNPRVRFVSATRVGEGELSQVRRTIRGGSTEAMIELTRVQPVRGDTLRAGTSGISADDLVEAGMRHYFLGEPLPGSLGMLEHMADPDLDRAALDRAFSLDDPVAGEVVRLLVVEALVGKGNAQAVTRVEIGPRHGDARDVTIEWLEPDVYINVEPQRRRFSGTWRLRGR